MKHILKDNPIENLTLATFSPTRLKSPPVTKFLQIDYAYAIGLAIACSVGATIFLLLFGYCLYHKCYVVDFRVIYGASSS